MFLELRRRYHNSAGCKRGLMLAAAGILAAAFLFSNPVHGAEETNASDDMNVNQAFAALLANEEVLIGNFPKREDPGERFLHFGFLDITGDGQRDLIVSKDELDSKQNGDTCFYAVENGKPCLIGVQKVDSLQKLGYHADSGYVYLYSEEEGGGQKVELLSFPEKIYDTKTGENNCTPLMTFTMSPDKKGTLHCFVDEKELTEKKFSKEFIKYLGKPAPFYEDAFYYGWDGYELAAELENTPEERLRIFGSDGSTVIPMGTETESPEGLTDDAAVDTEVTIGEMQAVPPETEASVVETPLPETEAAVEETQAPALEKETAVEETQVPAPETEVSEEETQVHKEESDTWVCPECGYEASGNFCGNCGTQNLSKEWICPGCGETVTGNFCQNCGTPRPNGQSTLTEDVGTKNQEITIQENPEIVSEANSWEENLLMEEHGALGELTADGNEAEAKEYVFDVPEWKRNSVERIYVLNTKQNMPANAVDVSGGKSGTVMAWMDEYNNLYIAGEGGVKVGEDASALFACYENVKEIHLDGNLHTDECTNMSHMFYHCYNLIDLNLDGLNTGNVVNMTKMFTACKSLHQIDVSQFETGKVESFYSLFHKCECLEELNLTSFHTENVRNMALMFYDCTALQKIVMYNQAFVTDQVETMSRMFANCRSLYYVDLSGFDMKSVKRTKYMFRNCEKLEGIHLDNQDFSNIENCDGMFEGSLMEADYGPNGEYLILPLN